MTKWESGLKGMRYLVAVQDYFFDHPNGAARVAWDFAEVVRRAGGTVGLVCMTWKPDAPTYARTVERGVEILRVKHPVLLPLDPRRASLTIQCVEEAVAATMSADDWDVIHIHSCYVGIGVVQALGPGPRVLKTIHSPIEEEYHANASRADWLSLAKSHLGARRYRKLEARELAISDVYHALSVFTTKEIARIHGEHIEINAIPHWCRTDLKRELSKEEARLRLGWPLDETILFTVRHHITRTGIDTAIDAVTPLAREGRCRFFIGGSGELFEHHQELVRKRGASSWIHLMGRISEEELKLAYQAADLFLLPTRALECFGLIVLEAYAYDCPVLSTTAGALPELVKPITPQLLCPPDDPDAMRTKIKAVLDGTVPLPAPGVLREYVSEKYGYDAIVPRLLSLFASVASAPKRAHA